MELAHYLPQVSYFHLLKIGISCCFLVIRVVQDLRLETLRLHASCHFLGQKLSLLRHGMESKGMLGKLKHTTHALFEYVKLTGTILNKYCPSECVSAIFDTGSIIPFEIPAVYIYIFLFPLNKYTALTSYGDKCVLKRRKTVTRGLLHPTKLHRSK